MSRDLLQDLNTNWAAWLTAMAEHVPNGEVRPSGVIPAASLGAPIPLFNQAFVFAQPSVDDLVGAVSWIGAKGLPFWVTAPDAHVDALRELAERVGLRPDADSMPGMTITLAEFSPTHPNGIEIVPVAGIGQLADVASVLAEGFGAPVEIAQSITPTSMLDDDRMVWLVGLVEGQAVACGQLIQTGDVAGVYSIAVREQYRRRGFGEAITGALLSAGLDRGCDVGVLQSSPMGQPVYARMGFEVVTDYHLFSPA